MKAANIKKKDIIEKELEKNVDLISEPSIKNKIQMNIIQKETEMEEKNKAYAKSLFSKRNPNKIDLEDENDDDL